ncbi:MAG TPA: radical SAM protein [Chthonomonadaceae bacterium]|nr:radical SAM protein [Chthonomonadaceae bacterium]
MSTTPAIDLVLINPGDRFGIYQSLGAELAAIEPPIWTGLLASYVRGKGFSVRIIDANAENMSPAQVAARIEEWNPTLTAVVVYGHNPSASTQIMPAASATCAAIKEGHPDRPILMVGGHVSALPERTLQEEAVDYVCIGEGMVTLTALIQALQSGTHPDLSQVPDLLYGSGEDMRRNPAAPLLQDLDHEMPGVAWDLLPMPLYRAHNWHCFDGLNRQPYAALYTTLGCPYKCNFCCIQSPFKSGEAVLGLKQSTNSYRYWSPEAVIAQIDTLVQQYGVRNIKFADEMFVLNRKHVEGICDLIIARGYDLNIWAYARVDTVRDGMLDKLKRAGFTWLAFGVESASEQVRDGAEKRFTQEVIFDTIRKVREAGIHVGANFIFGLPGDDLASMQATLDLALELNPEMANFYCAMAYPGSGLHELAVREKLPLPAKWSGYSQHSVDTQPLPTRYLSAAEVVRFRDQAFQTFYTSPKYLEMMERTFGAETLAHVREMTGHRLERKCA